MSVGDVLECSGTHLVERFWQFSELCEVRQVEGGISAVQDGKQVLLRFSETDAEIIMLRGNESVPAGWVSRSFDVKVPATTVVVRNKIHGNAALNVEIYLD